MKGFVGIVMTFKVLDEQQSTHIGISIFIPHHFVEGIPLFGFFTFPFWRFDGSELLCILERFRPCSNIGAVRLFFDGVHVCGIDMFVYLYFPLHKLRLINHSFDKSLSLA